MEKIKQQDYGDILKELQCPVCTLYMTSSVHLCNKGHNICDICYQNHDECPSCKANFADIRNFSLENLVKHVKFSCRNAHLGCKQYLALGQLLSHQQTCVYDTFSCPMSKVPYKSCSWAGSKMDMKDHVTICHKNWVRVYRGKEIVNIHNFDAEFGYAMVILAHDEVFLRRTEVNNDMWNCVLLYVGPESSASSFKYTISLFNKEGTESVTSSHVIHSVKEKLYDIYMQANCLQLPYKRLRQFLKMDNTLQYYMEIEIIER